jgi:hypothetical protein
MNQPLPHTFSVSPLTLLCVRQYAAHHRGCRSEGCVTTFVGPQGSWSRGISVDFCSRHEGRHCEFYDVLSVRTDDNSASWNFVDTVSQYNEETSNFSLMVTVTITPFNNVFNYRGYYYHFLWLCSPAQAMASTSTRFLDHTRRRATVGRTLLDEWSSRRRDLYLTTDKHPHLQWDSNQRSQTDSGRRPTP